MRHHAVSLALGAGIGLVTASSSFPVTLETRAELTSHLSNIHVSFNQFVDGVVSLTYGTCTSESHYDAHHQIGAIEDVNASRVVWIIPSDVYTEGCISAWNPQGVLVGRSEPQKLHNVRRRAPAKRGEG